MPTGCLAVKNHKNKIEKINQEEIQKYEKDKNKVSSGSLHTQRRAMSSFINDTSSIDSILQQGINEKIYPGVVAIGGNIAQCTVTIYKLQKAPTDGATSTKPTECAIVFHSQLQLTPMPHQLCTPPIKAPMLL